MHKKGKSGGNAHDRAVARAATAKDAPTPPTVLSIEPQARPDLRREWREPLSRTDSIGLLGVLVGIFLALIVPTVWEKVPAFALVCLGAVYLIWLSHWTYHLKVWERRIIAAVVVALLIIGAVPQFREQWRMEHMRSELAFNASAPGVAYPDGDHYGIKWFRGFAEVRLTVTSKAQFPIQSLNLSIWPAAKADAIAGMAQVDQEPQGCVIRRPREQLIPSTVLRGQDGSTADIAPFMNDQLNAVSTIRNHYDLLCQRILAGESIPLVIASLTLKTNGDMVIPPTQLHVIGDYETTAAEGSKRVPVDETVPISALQPWKK